MFQSPALQRAISERRKARKLSFHSPATFRAAADGDAKAKQRITPWGESTIPKISSLFTTSPQLPVFPLGTHDPIKARNWRTVTDMSLRQSHYVSALLSGRRPHPWADHQPLLTLGRKHFKDNSWVFDPTTNAFTWEAMLSAVRTALQEGCRTCGKGTYSCTSQLLEANQTNKNMESYKQFIKI